MEVETLQWSTLLPMEVEGRAPTPTQGGRTKSKNENFLGPPWGDMVPHLRKQTIHQNTLGPPTSANISGEEKNRKNNVCINKRTEKLKIKMS